MNISDTIQIAPSKEAWDKAVRKCDRCTDLADPTAFTWEPVGEGQIATTLETPIQTGSKRKLAESDLVVDGLKRRKTCKACIRRKVVQRSKIKEPPPEKKHFKEWLDHFELSPQDYFVPNGKDGTSYEELTKTQVSLFATSWTEVQWLYEMYEAIAGCDQTIRRRDYEGDKKPEENWTLIRPLPPTAWSMMEPMPQAEKSVVLPHRICSHCLATSSQASSSETTMGNESHNSHAKNGCKCSFIFRQIQDGTIAVTVQPYHNHAYNCEKVLASRQVFPRIRQYMDRLSLIASDPTFLFNLVDYRHATTDPRVLRALEVFPRPTIPESELKRAVNARWFIPRRYPSDVLTKQKRLDVTGE